LVYGPHPEYSEEARKAKFMGTCALNLVVGPDGRPRDIAIARSVGLGLDEKAIETVKTWKFEPALKDGKPVAVQIRRSRLSPVLRRNAFTIDRGNRCSIRNLFLQVNVRDVPNLSPQKQRPQPMKFLQLSPLQKTARDLALPLSLEPRYPSPAPHQLSYRQRR
jgi:TonB family protein